MKNYKEYAQNYEKKKYSLKDNTFELETDTSMSKVIARWKKDAHDALVKKYNTSLTTEELNMIKLGIRYNDARIGTAGNNAIWHALTANTNYMAAVYYVGKVIQK